MYITKELLINKHFQEKINLIYQNFRTKTKFIPENLDLDLYNLVSKLTLEDNLLTDQLRLELYHTIIDIFGVNWHKTPKKTIKKSITELSKLTLERFIEPKPEYSKSFSRNYGNLVIKDWIKKFFLLDPEMYLTASKSAVRIFMDMNGLGKLNLIGKPFHTLSKTIGLFVDILKNSETTKLLKKSGLEFKLSVDGGDEFSIFIYDPKHQINVYALVPEIKFSYLLEMEESNINHLLDKKRMELYFDKEKLPIIHVSSSIGSISFWELINNLSVQELSNKNRDQFLDFLSLRWFDLAYAESNKFKHEYKQSKIVQNPKLYSFLFTK